MAKGIPNDGINKGWFTRERTLGNKNAIGNPAWNKGAIGIRRGMKNTPEQNEKIRVALIGNKNGLGKRKTDEAKARFTESMKRTYDEKGRKTPANLALRMSTAYAEWRKAVFARDNFTCVMCLATNGEGTIVILNADHIYPFSKYLSVRFKLENGRTLCVECHKKTPTFGIKAINYQHV